MAKGKYAKWITPDGLTLLQGWAREGLTDEQLAHNIGINPDTLYAWKKKYPEISEALKKGKDVVDFEVENAMLKSALEGNVTAQIYWLKNRKAIQWRDNQPSATNESALSRLDNIIDAVNQGMKP